MDCCCRDSVGKNKEKLRAICPYIKNEITLAPRNKQPPLMNDKIKLFWLSPWTRIKNKITLTWNEKKSSVSASPKVGKNVKFYLDCKIYEAWFIHKKKWNMVFLGGVVQLAFLVSSFYRSNINGHAVRLHITHHSAAPLIGTSALQITRSFMAMFCIGSRNIMFRQSSPGENKTNRITYSFRLSLTRTKFLIVLFNW